MRSEGVRRLSVFLGTVGGLVWIVYVVIASDGFEGFETKNWLAFILGLPVAFGGPFGLVRGLAWVVEGFRHDKSNP